MTRNSPPARVPVRWAATAATLLILVGAIPRSAATQDRVEVRGSVRNEEGEPLRGVQIYTPASRRGTLSDDRGGFVLRGVPHGPVELHLSHIGFAPVRLTVHAEPDATPVRVVLRSTPLTLPGMEVTATPGGRDPLAVTQATSQLGGAELERELGSSLAQTLRTQPGVAVRFMGPAATMPVLRGLTGDRILVLQDGQRTGDLAGSADDHGVTIDPLAAQRVEIVRGPATLLYGNNAVGGVVNVISGDLPSALPSRVEGMLALQSESAFPGAAASGRVALPISDGWVATARGAARSTDDMRIPRDPELGTRLSNTDARNFGAALGAGRIGEQLTAGVSLRTYHFAYGLPIPPGTDAVGLRGRRYEIGSRAELTPPGPVLTGARVDATGQDYRHEEFDEATGDGLQTFSLRTQTADLLLRQGKVGPVSEGAWGASLLLKHYAATGPQALTPPADSRGFGVFGFQEVALWSQGPALQLGGRLDLYRIESAESEKFGPAVHRVFRALSGAAGLRVPLSSAASASMHVGRSFRAPTVEELFSGAAHAGTGAVELGEPSLVAEKGVSIEAMVRARSPRWTGQLSVYRNAIADYVHLAAVGDTVLGGATLPVLRYTQEGAVLIGAEGSVEWAVNRSVVVGAMGDYLHASRDDGTPLSYMPPPRLGMLVRWDGGTLSLGGDLHHELTQNRVGAAAELPTPAHTIVRLHAGLRFRRDGRTHSITVRAENLGNELHREATSRIKDFAPGPGRNISVGYRLYY